MWHVRQLVKLARPSLLTAMRVVFATALSTASATDNSSVVKVGSWPPFAVSSLHRVSVTGNYMFVSVNGFFRTESGAFIFDVSDLTRPRLVGSFKRAGGLMGSEFDGSIFYATQGTNTVIVDLAKPAGSNVLATSTNLLSPHTAKLGNLFFVAKPGEMVVLNAIGGTNLQQVGVYTDARFSAPSRVVVQGDRAFISDADDLFIIDVKEPSAPKLLAQHLLEPNGQSQEAVLLAVSGDHLYLRGPYETDGRDLIVWNVSDPLAPAEVARLHGTTEGEFYASDARLVGTTLFLSHESRLSIVDITVPSQPGLIFKSRHYGGGDIFVDRGHAFISGPKGISILNISDSTNIELVTQYRIPRYTREVILKEKFAYLFGGDEGFYILDVSNPSFPNPIGYRPWDVSAAIIEGRYAYTIAQSWGSEISGLNILDLSDPAQPIVVGSHDHNLGGNLAISGGTLFIGSSFGFSAFDVLDITAPEKIGYFEVNNRGGSAFRARGEFLYFGNHIFDISDPAHPVEVGKFQSDPLSVLFDPVFVNDIAFAITPYYLFVYDVSNPSQPLELTNKPQNGYYDTALDKNILVSGGIVYDVSVPTNLFRIGTLAYTNGVAVSDGRIYINTQGLEIYQVNLAPSPTLSIRVTGTQLELFWPIEPAGFKLQRTTLLPAEEWFDISDTISQGINQCSVQIDHPATPTFFRLIKR